MKTACIQLTPRDLNVLHALDRHPLTAEQLLRISHGFEQPFSQLRLVQRRLKKLADGGLVKAFPFALLTGGSPRYYKLTRRGYWLVHGRDTPIPKRRHFEAISPARHPHTHGLAEFMTGVEVDIARRNWRLSNYAPENTFKLKTDVGVVYPDGAFQIQTNSSRYDYFVEYDTGSERVRTSKDVESIERKLKIYDAWQMRYEALDPRRPVVVFVTKGRQRLAHILDAARDILKNPHRTVVVGTTMQAIQHDCRLTETGFVDNRGRRRGLVPASSANASAEPDNHNTINLAAIRSFVKIGPQTRVVR